MAFTGIMCTEADITDKEGAGVSASVTEEMHNRWTLMAESFVNMTCHKNYSDDYAGLNADVKYILTDVVSSKVAMFGIQYDMSGYTSLPEAQTQLDVLRDAIVKGIELLKETNNRTFLEAA